MIGISNSNKTCYQNGCQSRTNAYIQLQMECYIGINIKIKIKKQIDWETLKARQRESERH